MIFKMNETKKDKLRQWITTGIVLVVNIIVALGFTNVPYLVAQYRPVLLGRYTDGHVSVMIIVWLISLAVLSVTWLKPEKRRKRTIGIIAATISILFTVGLFDLVLRLFTPVVYIPDGKIYHREPNKVFTGVTHDVPPHGFSFPFRPPASENVEYTLTTDARGFRNKKALDKCEVLVLGDSFAEGSEVSDDQAWAALVATQTGKVFYNLAMAGEDPSSYLETYEQIGHKLQPKTVLVMIYEGNDYRKARDKTQPSFTQRCRRFHKSSPLLRAAKSTMRATLGNTCKVTLPVSESDKLWPVAWLPVGVGEKGSEKFYTFKWKRLRAHYVDKALFKKTDGFKNATGAVATLAEKCKANAAKIIVLYVPDKPHVVLPIADKQQRLNKKQVVAYLKLKKAKNLPADMAGCYNKMLESLDVQEQAFAEFCKEKNIEFVSLTELLKNKTAAGDQLYFTYDQHWTPLGNKVVAEKIAAVLKK